MDRDLALCFVVFKPPLLPLKNKMAIVSSRYTTWKMSRRGLLKSKALIVVSTCTSITVISLDLIWVIALGQVVLEPRTPSFCCWVT